MWTAMFKLLLKSYFSNCFSFVIVIFPFVYFDYFLLGLCFQFYSLFSLRLKVETRFWIEGNENDHEWNATVWRSMFLERLFNRKPVVLKVKPRIHKTSADWRFTLESSHLWFSFFFFLENNCDSMLMHYEFSKFDINISSWSDVAISHRMSGVGLENNYKFMVMFANVRCNWR